MLASVENYASLEADFNAGTISTYAITFPVGTVGANMDKKFNGYLKSCKITGIEPDGVLKISATVKVSGSLKPFSRFIESLTVTSVAGATTGTMKAFESVQKNVVKKKAVEEKIEDLVKKSKDSDVTGKDYNPKVSKIIDTLTDIDLTEKQLEDLEKAIQDKKNKKDTAKNI